MNSPNAFKVAGAIRSRLRTIFAQIDVVPTRDLELMSGLVQHVRLPAGWLDRTIKQVKTNVNNEYWSAS